MFLDKYKDIYKDFYNIFLNELNENKINHAYMFEIDDTLDIDEFIKNISKFIILKNSSNCQIEKMIDNNTYSNIKIVECDGMWIKKEQISEIERDFMEESLDNRYKIYFIKEADKLNKSSANALLKFLEEPENNIIAILLTKNKYAVISTIVSRCQNISLKLNRVCDDTCQGECIEIINILEKYREKSLPYINIFLIDNKKDRKEYVELLENIQKIYFDLLLFRNNQNNNFFSIEFLSKFNYLSSNDETIKMIELIEKSINYLKYNINIKAIFDKIVLGVYGDD